MSFGHPSWPPAHQGKPPCCGHEGRPAHYKADPDRHRTGAFRGVSGTFVTRGWRRDWQAGTVEDDRARRRERPPGHPVMVTAQQQVRRMVPAGHRRHDRDNRRPGRAAAGTVGIPQRAPVNGAPGGLPGTGRFAASGGVPPEETAHKGRLPQASCRVAGSQFPSQEGRKARDCLTRGRDGRGAVPAKFLMSDGRPRKPG